MRHIILTAAALAASLTAQSQAQTLTAGMAAPVTSLDPHFYNAAPNNGLAMHVFERLVERNSTARVTAGLASSWKPVGEAVWEFKLRPGARWHDGVAVTADDVVFSLKRGANVPNSPGGYGGLVRAIQRVEVVDPMTLRFHTGTPSPNVPGDIAGFAIVSRHVGEGATTEEYNSGKATVGSGPYKLGRYLNGDRVELVRNEAWDGEKPAWERVNFRFITNPGARVAALLAGDVDIIDVPPAADIPRLQTDPKLSVVSIQGLRLVHISPSVAKESTPWVTDNAGKPLEKNPFKDVRVRRALSMAINRQAIADRVMSGTAAPTGQWLPPGTYSHAPSVGVPSFDPEGAKKLLAEAGFPQGFKLTLHSPNDRYPYDASTAQAVAQYWARVGVATQVEALPWSTFSPRAARQEFAISLAGWGSNTGEASYMLVNVLGTYDPATNRGASNSARRSIPALDALTDRALATIDDAAREKLLIQAVELASAEVATIPLHQLINFWASKKTVVYEPRQDERTVAMQARPAK